MDDRRESPRRRGGRAAIRSRGGEREIIPERPREPAPEHLGKRPHAAESLPEPEAERIRPAEPERPRERLREPEPERGRGLEPEPPRERVARPHDRAGEPGYVPAASVRAGPPPGLVPIYPPRAGRISAAELEPEAELETESAAEETAAPAGKLDGPRRRRRRRGRRRDGDRPGTESSAVRPAEAFEPEDQGPRAEPRFEREVCEAEHGGTRRSPAR